MSAARDKGRDGIRRDWSNPPAWEEGVSWSCQRSVRSTQKDGVCGWQEQGWGGVCVCVCVIVW
jgi:hypothetical protein